MSLWTISLRSDVQRWPVVPAAANNAPRTASSISASSITTMALLPPSSSSDLPSRCATFVPTCLPIRTDPVAEMSGSRLSLTIASPTGSTSPMARLNTPSNPDPSITVWQMFCTATAVSGVVGEGFQIIVSPHTAARNAFQDHTATGKLNALMIPTGPSGCHCSYMRWRGRSDAIVNPYNCRERPTAKSAMSIISCTSPSPSARILPTSIDTRAPRGSLNSRRAFPMRRTYSPR